MSNEPTDAKGHGAADPNQVRMPRPTVAPVVLSLGLIMLAAGLILGTAFLSVGGILLVSGIWMWFSELLPGKGHMDEELAPESHRPRAATPQVGKVAHLREGMVGYRVRLPENVHPISAGVKGGIAGGLVMPLPAIVWSVQSGHGIWYPLNLLPGMMLSSVGNMTDAQLEQFHPLYAIVGIAIHVVMAVVVGLVYGVLLPTLPSFPPSVAWGGLTVPLLWSGLLVAAMPRMDPLIQNGISWPWFIISQFLFGVATAVVVSRRSPDGSRIKAGLLGGLAGGMIMPIPALLWGHATGHGIWYPVNLMGAMLMRPTGTLTIQQLEAFDFSWLAIGLALHFVMSLGVGTVYAFVLDRLPRIPGSLAWGGLLFPILWTGVSYSLMGIVNPVLQERVSWAWYILSQFIFGAVAAVVVEQQETIAVPPAGRGVTDGPHH
jgi:hypothetical protein